MGRLHFDFICLGWTSTYSHMCPAASIVSLSPILFDLIIEPKMHLPCSSFLIFQFVIWHQMNLCPLSTCLVLVIYSHMKCGLLYK